MDLANGPLDLRQAALAGLTLSILLYVGGAWLAWLSARRSPPRSIGGTAPASEWLIQLARFAYFVLLPYALLLRGAGLLASTVGVIGPEPLARSLLGWTEAWLPGTLLAGVASVAVALALRWSLWAARAGAVYPELPSGWALVRETLFQQAHWAFYRAALAVWLGVYGAQFAALLICACEYLLTPQAWRVLRQPAAAAGLAVTGALAWLSAGVFFATGNLWLTTSSHLLAVSLLASRRAPSELPAAEHTPTPP